MRCSIYGKNLNEWDELARWLTAHDLHKPLGTAVLLGKALGFFLSMEPVRPGADFRISPRNPIQHRKWGHLQRQGLMHMDRGLLFDLSNMEVVKSTENPRVWVRQFIEENWGLMAFLGFLHFE